MSLWLVGSGSMALDYIKVLQALGQETTVIGRGPASAEAFAKASGVPVVQGGLDACLASGARPPEVAIVSVSVEQLAAATLSLLRAGVRRILVEKPGGIDSAAVKQVADVAASLGASVVLGYNRRFYASVATARRMIFDDGGPTSFTFEFTEWSHVIATLQKPTQVFENWFLANSSHVVDTAFFLGGDPRELTCFTAGGLEWHPAASSFAGAGVTAGDVPFSYHANWAAPGRWGVEVLTRARRYFLRPMEQLQVQEIGSVAVGPVPIEDALDTAFKPGLHNQVQAFLENRLDDFCTVAEQVRRCSHYDAMCGRAPVPAPSKEQARS